MAIGDLVTLRKPFTFTKTTDDGVTPIVESAAVFTATDYEIISSNFVETETTKEGVVLGTVVTVARRLT